MFREFDTRNSSSLDRRLNLRLRLNLRRGFYLYVDWRVRTCGRSGAVHIDALRYRQPACLERQGGTRLPFAFDLLFVLTCLV